MSEPTNRRLMEGSEAIAEAAIAAGCRFFSGYPMTPFPGRVCPRPADTCTTPGTEPG